jgi:CRP-like cAMP-binding protein
VLRQVNAMMTKDEARRALEGSFDYASSQSDDSKEAVVALLGVDEFSGEGCLIGQPKRLAVAVTVSECTIMRWRSEIQRLLQQAPAFLQMFLLHRQRKLKNRNQKSCRRCPKYPDLRFP